MVEDGPRRAPKRNVAGTVRASPTPADNTTWPGRMRRRGHNPSGVTPHQTHSRVHYAGSFGCAAARQSRIAFQAPQY